MSNKLDLTPPVDRPEFKKYWKTFIEDIGHRDNMKQSHLEQLRILCDICVRYDRICEIIDEEGYTYTIAGGRNGNQIKPRPEVLLGHKYLAEIRLYSSMLGVKLLKDTATKPSEEEDEYN